MGEWCFQAVVTKALSGPSGLWASGSLVVLNSSLQSLLRRSCSLLTYCLALTLGPLLPPGDSNQLPWICLHHSRPGTTRTRQKKKSISWELNWGPLLSHPPGLWFILLKCRNEGTQLCYLVPGRVGAKTCMLKREPSAIVRPRGAPRSEYLSLFSADFQQVSVIFSWP